MQSPEASCEEGERAYKKAKICRSSLPLLHIADSEVQETPPAAPFCIHTKLRELYLEERCNLNDTGLRRNSLLLEKLVNRERLNTLILNLYPGNKGYSLAFRSTPRVQAKYSGLVQSLDDTANMIETKLWPYEEDELLTYVDNEKLPAYILDLLEPDFTFLFYSGCVILEVRDYRQSYPHFKKCDIHHVLLKPSSQSILSDVNQIMEERVDWGPEEKQQLESQLLLAKMPSLCLEPNTSAFSNQSRIYRTHQFLNTHRLRRTARKFSQVTVNRKRKLDPFTHRPGLELFEYLSKQRSKMKGGLGTKRTHDDVKPVPVPNLEAPAMSPPPQGVQINEFKFQKRPEETSDCLPQLVQECVLETDMPKNKKGETRVYHIKLSILQRPSNLEYLGELYLDRDHKEGERNGVACRFSLGSRMHARNYLHQFTDIFTEGGRKAVRVKYTMSPGSKEPLAMMHTQVHPQHNWCVQLNATESNAAQNANVPMPQTRIQSNQLKPTNEEVEINALATKLMNSGLQFQAAANAKQQQQKLASVGNNAALINLLNSSPASNVNNDANAAVVNAINSPSGASLLPQHVQTVNQKLFARKLALANSGTCVRNSNNIINAVNNNNRINLTELNSHLTQSSNFTQPNFVKQPVINQRLLASSNEKKSALSALLVGTPAADCPDIIGPNTNPLLLEKLAGTSGANANAGSASTNFIQSPKSHQYTVQSPKSVVSSPLSSPPPQPTNTINLQGLNFAPLQNLPGLQNIQVQLQGFPQPISLSLNVSSSAAIQGHPANILVSLPVTTAGGSVSNVTPQAAPTTLLTTVSSPTVVLANAGTGNLAHLVTSGVKGLSQQGLRSASSTAVTQQFQLLAPLQRPRMPQVGAQQNAARGIQRTPITIKMATPNATQVTLPNALSSQQQLQYSLQKPSPLQQYQQLCQQKVRRRSNASDAQQ